MDSANFRRSPFFNDKKSVVSETSTKDNDLDTSLNVKNSIVPVHSPVVNKDSNLSRSPLVKKDTKVQLEGNKVAKVANTTDIDVTHV